MVETGEDLSWAGPCGGGQREAGDILSLGGISELPRKPREEEKGDVPC